MRGSKSTSVLCTGRKLLGFNLWIEIDLVLVCGPKMTSFQVWGSIEVVLCGWSKLTWFLYGGRISLRFSVSIELDFVFVRVVELDLLPVCGSDLTWFWCGGRKGL